MPYTLTLSLSFFPPASHPVPSTLISLCHCDPFNARLPFFLLGLSRSSHLSHRGASVSLPPPTRGLLSLTRSSLPFNFCPLSPAPRCRGWPLLSPVPVAVRRSSRAKPYLNPGYPTLSSNTPVIVAYLSRLYKHDVRPPFLSFFWLSCVENKLIYW
jgi:hypothetical protein